MELDNVTIWKIRAATLVRHCCALAEMPEVIDCIEIEFCQRKRTTIGTAWTHFDAAHKYPAKHPLHPFTGRKPGGLIKINTKVFQRAPETECIETLTHEIAHILANLKAGKCVGHKRGWKEMMKKLGYPNPSRCHTVDVKDLARRQKRYILKCPGCQWLSKITAARRTRWYKKLKKGLTEIRCTKCSYLLSYKDLIKAEEVK